MDTRQTLKSFFVESALWNLSNLVCVGLPVALTYVVLHGWLDRPAPVALGMMAVVATLTSTWGSWASLVWTQNRVLRSAQRLLTLVPGLALIGLAGMAFYVGRGGLLFKLVLLGGGVGTLAASAMLSRQISRIQVADTRLRFLMGMVVYPVLTTVAAGAVGYLWYVFVTNPLQTDWRFLLSFAFFAVSSLAAALVSTGIPATTSLVCRRLLDGGRR